MLDFNLAFLEEQHHRFHFFWAEVIPVCYKVWRQALFEVIHEIKECHPCVFNSWPFDCPSDNRTFIYNIYALLPHSCILLAYGLKQYSTDG